MTDELEALSAALKALVNFAPYSPATLTLDGRTLLLHARQWPLLEQLGAFVSGVASDARASQVTSAGR